MTSVLSAKAVRSGTEPEEPHSPEGKARVPAKPARPIALEYLGFEDVRDRREYRFDARNGDHARRYTVSIQLAAFSKRQALLQDGPDICYQRLARDMAGSELPGDARIAVSEGDLAAYRETHTPTARRSFGPPRPNPGRDRA